MAYVERYEDGTIKGVYHTMQEGYAEEEVADNASELLTFLSPSKPVVTVTPRQARLALLSAGLLDQVQATVDAAGGATKITWEYATVIERNSPLIETLGGSLGLTATQIDTLFRFAATQ